MKNTTNDNYYKTMRQLEKAMSDVDTYAAQAAHFAVAGGKSFTAAYKAHCKAKQSAADLAALLVKQLNMPVSL